jgi:hypothetical protein
VKTPLFTFLGVTENGTNANMSILKSQLEASLPKLITESTFEEKGELLIITVKPPRFCFYISFVNNDSNTLSEWKEMAKNFELPWDIKPVDKTRLSDVIAYVEANGWAQYRSILEIGYTVLKEMERFDHCKVFTIPSIGKPSIWKKIFKI